MEPRRSNLALDTDRSTAIIVAMLFLVVSFDFASNLWRFASGRIHLVSYQPLTWGNLKSINYDIDLLFPFLMLLIAFNVWRDLDRFQKLVAALWIGEILISGLLVHIQVSQAVRSTVSMMTASLGVVVPALIAVAIVIWFRSIVRYV